MKACKRIVASLVVVALGYGTAAQAASVYNNVVLGDNPVAFYEMNESSGTVAVDSIAGQNGVYSGGVTLGVAGPQPPAFVGFDPTNTAAQFDASTSSIMDTGTAIATLGTSYSYEIWFNYTFTGALQYIGGRFGATYPGDAIFSSSSELSYFDGTAVSGGAGTTAIPTGWDYLVMTHTGSTVDVYLNGVFDFTAASTDQYGASNRIVAGNRGDDAATTGFNGPLDELAVYNTVLTPTQIAAHYEAAFTTPEPSAVMLLGVGSVGLLKRKRRMARAVAV